MKDDEAVAYQRLCRRAARAAIGNRGIDIEDVTQDLLLWVLQTKSITSPEHRSLPTLLKAEANKIVRRWTFEAQPHGWSHQSWSLDEIRDQLKDNYSNLPEQIEEALCSDRMPGNYFSAIDSAYASGLMPERSNRARYVELYRAVERLQEVVNYPSDLGQNTQVMIEDLTGVEEASLSITYDNRRRQRNREQEYDFDEVNEYAEGVAYLPLP